MVPTGEKHSFLPANFFVVKKWDLNPK